MPWVKFNADTFRGEEESPMSVYMRGSKRNETFTQAVEDMTLHDREKLLDLCYESAGVPECQSAEEAGKHGVER